MRQRATSKFRFPHAMSQPYLCVVRTSVLNLKKNDSSHFKNLIIYTSIGVLITEKKCQNCMFCCGRENRITHVMKLSEVWIIFFCFLLNYFNAIFVD